MNPLLPWIAKTLSSSTLRTLRRQGHACWRTLTGKTPTVHVFISPADPYSVLLLQVLPQLKQRFNVDWQCHTVMERPADMYPKPEYWFKHALQDSQHLSRLYDLPVLRCLPDDEQIEALAHLWATHEETPEFLEQTRDSGLQLWTHNEMHFDQQVDVTCHRIAERIISRNESLRHKLGHYFSAMLYFEGEWYWGLDRLAHLEARLNQAGFHNPNEGPCRVEFNRQHAHFCSAPANSATNPTTGGESKTLTLYFSLRSPYSYLALVKAQQLHEHYGVKIDLRVVLPMVMRGLTVPNQKKMYIFYDTKREADMQKIPYGFLTDPLGKGVLNCYALYDAAQKQGKGFELMLSFAKGINSEARNAENAHDLRLMVERAGLDWASLKEALVDAQDPSNDEPPAWRAWADQHEQALYQLGLWGVPCLVMDELTLWGQDRFFVIEQRLASQSA